MNRPRARHSVKRSWWLSSLIALAIVSPGPRIAGQESPDAVQEEVEAATDAQRVRRIGEAIKLDREHLERAQADQSRRQELFDLLAELIATWKAEREDKRVRFAATSDPAERARLESELSKLDGDLELLRAQSELAFSALATVRQQIGVLEKKIEREQRTLDVLTGVAPEVTAGAPRDSAPAAPQPAAAPAGPDVSMAPAETTVQIETMRELERRKRQAGEAELHLVEFVKRKRSLEQLMALEAKLLETAGESEGNLTRFLERRRADLEAAGAVDPSGAEAERYRQGVAFIERLLDGVRPEIDDRTAYLEALNKRLARLVQEELAVTREAAARREAVEGVRARLRRLQSPLHPQNLARWLRERGPRILMVLAAGVLLLAFVRLGIRRLVRLLLVRRKKGPDSGSDRADTLAFSLRSAMTLVIVIAGVFLLLEEGGVDVKTVLGGAAILGFAVAFGLQNLMRDFFTGFLILLEKQFELGDLVTLGGITGIVESVNIRVTMLRDLEGRVHFVPNGEIKSVTNRTYRWGRAVLEIPVGYQENVDRVIEALAEVARGVREDPKYAAWITEEPEMLGVKEFAVDGVVIQLMMKTVPREMSAVRRELLRRVKNKFDEVGISIRGKGPAPK